MSDELHDSIRAALRADAERAPGGGGLDAAAAISGARRRRRPKVAVVTGATAFAAVGILAIALPAVLQPISFTSTSGGAPMSDQVEVSQTESFSDESADSAIKRAPAERIALCEAPFPFAAGDAEVGSMSGLVLEAIVDPASIPSGTTVTATARVTNPTTSTITGRTTTAAAAFIGVDGATRWHSPGGLGVVDRDFVLEPGASIDLPMTITAASCTVDDDLAALDSGAFPDGLAPLTVGSALVVAALDLSVGSADAGDAPMLLDLLVSSPIEVLITE